MRENLITDAQPTPERKLWGAALALLLADARHYLESNKKKEPHHKEAFDDLCYCGVMTKRLCRYLDIEPDWLSERFRRYVREYLYQRDT